MEDIQKIDWNFENMTLEELFDELFFVMVRSLPGYIEQVQQSLDNAKMDYMKALGLMREIAKKLNVKIDAEKYLNRDML